MKIDDLPTKYQEQAREKLAKGGLKPNKEKITLDKGEVVLPRETPKNAPVANKYRNVKETIGNIKFDSQKEARRFEELLLMEQTGEIRDLKLQHEFTLQGAFTDTHGERTRAIKYIADFTYWQGNVFVIEDVKSDITKNNATYKLKKKLMAEKGWRITET